MLDTLSQTLRDWQTFYFLLGGAASGLVGLTFRDALAPVFENLNQYVTTTHFVGQTIVSALTEDRGSAESYCLAHHITIHGAKRRLMLASLRYLDTFVKVDGTSLFAERLLYVDWQEERELSNVAT